MNRLHETIICSLASLGIALLVISLVLVPTNPAWADPPMGVCVDPLCQTIDCTIQPCYGTEDCKQMSDPGNCIGCRCVPEGLTGCKCD